MKKKKSLSNKVGKIATKENVKKTIKKANETSSFIIENKNAFLLGTGVILGILAIREIKKSFQRVGEAFESEAVDFIEPEITPATNNLTISSQESVNLAKSLLDAMNATTFMGLPATDEQKIADVFKKIQTGDDFKLVFNAFAKRKRFAGGTPTSYVAKKTAEAYDLIYWLKAEVDPFCDETLYNTIKHRVESAGLIF